MAGAKDSGQDDDSEFMLHVKEHAKVVSFDLGFLFSWLVGAKQLLFEFFLHEFY